MFWIIATIFLALIFWISVFFGLSARKKEQVAREAGQLNAVGDLRFLKRVGVGAAATALFLWVLLTVFSSVTQVGEREVGVIYSFSGTIEGATEPGGGVVWTMPWEHVKKENIALQDFAYELAAGNEAVTRDQQSITARLAVNLQVEPESVEELFSTVGPNWREVLLEARVLQDFKEITATFTTPQLTAERERLRQETASRLRRELEPYSIDIVDVFVKNIGFGQEYSQEIERKVVQQQATLREEEKKKQIQAQADQKVIAAQGEAEANRLRRETLTPLLLQQQAIEKLNNKVTMIICPPNAVCVPNAPIVAPGQP